jgi:hypothetical protein
MMVLVRKNELACREHWDGGLWEPRESIEPVPISNIPPSTLVAESPVSDHLRQQYTDRVTSVGIAPTNRPIAETTVPTEQIGRRESPNPVSSQPVERTIPVAEHSHAGSSQETSASSPAVHRESWGAPLPDMKRSEPTERPRDESPRPTRPADPNPSPSPRAPLPAEENFRRSWGAPRAFDEDQIRPVVPRRADLEKRASAGEPPQAGRAREDRSSNIDDISQLLSHPRSNGVPPTPARSDPDIERFGSRQPTGSISSTPPEDAPLSGGRRGWTEPFETTDQRPKRPAEATRPAPVERELEPSPQEMRSQPEPAKVAMNPKLAKMSQCCGTCRDFRPAEGGERGWCNNPYAFDHRRMVRKNEVACRSTIGDWWIPSDDWWMQQADYSHHGRPTPIVDDLLRQLLDSRANGTNARNNGRG